MQARPLGPVWAGPVLMCAASLVFAILDTGAKYLAAHYPVLQVTWVRYMVQTLGIVAIYSVHMGRELYNAHSYSLQLFRGLCLCGGSVLMIYGLVHLPLGEATAIVFLGPVLVTLMSGFLLKEQARSREWLAVACGFSGVLIIARPGGGLMTWAILFPLGVAICSASYQLVTRFARSSEHPATSNFYTGLVGAIILTPGGLVTWSPMAWLDFLLLIGLGGLATLGHLAITHALLRAPAASLSGYNYTQILWAVLLGGVAFDMMPDAMSWLGIAVIALGGLMLTAPQFIRWLLRASQGFFGRLRNP